MSAHRWHRPSLRLALCRGEVATWLRRHPRSSYVIQAVLATPPWVDVAALKALAQERDRLTKETGIVHVLDHIVPLNHPRVCGLNVPANIQIIPRARNAAKSNAWCDEQLDLFAI